MMGIQSQNLPVGVRVVAVRYYDMTQDGCG
jgi:hypothetical protein